MPTRSQRKKVKETSGIFLAYWKKLPELMVAKKNKRKSDVKRECIDDITCVEVTKEVERKLWLTYYYKLYKKLSKIVREKCTGCQMNEPNQFGYRQREMYWLSNEQT